MSTLAWKTLPTLQHTRNTTNEALLPFSLSFPPILHSHLALSTRSARRFTSFRFNSCRITKFQRDIERGNEKRRELSARRTHTRKTHHVRRHKTKKHRGNISHRCPRPHSVVHTIANRKMRKGRNRIGISNISPSP